MSFNNTLTALGHAVSGSAGTAVSTAAIFPLDLVTTRLKAQRMMRGASKPSQPRYEGIADALRAVVEREGGLPALYHGLGPDVAKSVLDSFLFFGFYSYLRSRNRHPGVVVELAMGAFAGACSRAFTTPISTVVTRMQMASETMSLRQTLADVYHGRGLLGLWSGYSATIFLTLNPSITFFVNRRLAKRILPALQEEDIPVAWVAFLLAALSKATATALTYPFQTGRLRLQMASEAADDAPPKSDKNDSAKDHQGLLSLLGRLLDKSVIGIIFKIITKEGRRALYDGLQGELLKGFLSHGLTMLMKGLFFRLAVRLWLLSRPHMRKRLQTK
ncbi:mitochondrial carrier protein [Hirsutella rhossiliensis]|uniref:Mitochondrial carrier protein n=1 Tax=Hirsutella rhossiliensis TaxID=111463 RepID=A0A9P8MSM0_9HYPO|nr:mitochondrial carrier protein [Hirsutella rhossiliensis]KAH0960535.1 mitochondrial carrier protein [Hirsutella rhossiliensis]